jgi:hypothetical protein
MVYRGRTKTGGIPNEAVDVLVAKFLLRAEVKSGGTWYELVHDRFIEPILQSNREWREEQPLIRVAQNWADSGRPASSLLQGEQLKEVLGSTNWHALGPLVREYLDASRTAQAAKEEADRAQREGQQQRELEQVRALAAERQRRITTIAIMGGVAVVLAFVAGTFGVQALQNAGDALFAKETAAQAEEIASTAEKVAENSMDVAATSDKRATQAQGTADAFEATSEALSGTATSNAATGQALSSEATSNAATAEALGTAAAANASEAQRILEQQDLFFAAVAAATTAKETEVAIADATAISRSATATAVAVLPPTSTATPTETATPAGPVTPPAADEPTVTPTPAATRTPDSEAQIQAEVAALNATQTAIAEVYATQTVVSSSRSCLVELKGEFADVWKTYGARLGCPVQQPIGGQFAEQPFENGYMIWSAIPDPDLFFAIVGGDKGKWFVADQKEVDSYNPRDGVSCELDTSPPNGLYQPIRGFGALWCGREDIRDQVGWGTMPEFAVIDDALQRFENGFLLRDSRGFIHVLFNNGSYVRLPG